VSIISQAKREAARRSLYSRFLRGPVITQEALDLESANTTTETAEGSAVSASAVASSPFTSTCPSPDGVSEPSAAHAPKSDKRERKDEKAARKKVRAERREGKAIRREARAAKKARKVEEAAKKAAKLEKKAEKAEKERTKAKSKPEMLELSAEDGHTLGVEDQKPAPADGEQRKKDRKRKHDH
jgi:hypothetical protein